MNFTQNHELSTITQEDQIKARLYHSLITENIQAIAIVDEELRFLTANAAFCTLLDLPRQDNLNCFHISVLPFSKDSNFNSLLNGLVTNKFPRFEVETNFKDLNKSTRYLKLRMVGSFGNNQFNGGTLFLEDITNLKEKVSKSEKRIRQLREENQKLNKYIDSNSQLESFAHLASHDMKQPLRMIGNFSQLLEKRYGEVLGDSGKEYLKYIVDGAKDMNLFLNDLLAFARLDKEAHVGEMINLENLSFLIGMQFQQENGDNFELIFSEEMPKNIFGCKERIRTLFIHLISNAVKFSQKEEKISIKINGRETEKFWQFEIEDNGIGIKNEFFDKIFLLFKRLHSRSEYDGSGIGLALCKKITEQHDGEIWVESEFGKGSKFAFTIKKPA